MLEYRSGKGRGQTVLHRAVIKHGWDNFTTEILERGIETQEALDAAEDAFIMSLNTMSPHGYNLRGGGSGGKHSAETKDKMSEAKRGEKHPLFGKRGEKSPRFGKKHSLETRKKMSASQRGRKHSPETRKKQSESMRGRPKSAEHRRKLSEAPRPRGEQHHNFGKTRSAETIAKMRASQQARRARELAASSSTPLL